MDKHGPNMARLWIRFISRQAIPKGGGFANGMEFLGDPDLRHSIIEKAEASMKAAILLIKSAPNNPWGDDDEAIAGALLKEIEERGKKP